jgi:hypothetical protein
VAGTPLLSRNDVERLLAPEARIAAVKNAFLKSPAAAAVLEAKGMKVDSVPGQDRQATRRVP